MGSRMERERDGGVDREEWELEHGVQYKDGW